MNYVQHKFLKAFSAALISWVIAGSAVAQTKVDSLLKLVQSCSDDRECATALLALGEAKLYSAPDSALQFYQRVANLKSGDNRLQGQAVLGLAKATCELGHDSIGLPKFDEAFELVTAARDSTLMCEVARMYGSYLIEAGQYPKAQDWLKRSIQIGRLVTAVKPVAIAYSNLGVSYYYAGDIKRAAEAFIASVKWGDANGHEASIGLLMNISGISQEMADWESALAYSERALEMARNNDNKPLERSCYHNIGAMHTKLGDFALAEEFLNRANDINLQLNDSSHMSRYHTGMADNYLAQGNLEKTIEHYQKAKNTLPSKSDVRQLMFAHLNLSRTYRQLSGDTVGQLLQLAADNGLVAYRLASKTGLVKNKGEAAEILFRSYAGLGLSEKAVGFGKEYMAIHDSLLTQDKIKAIAELQEQYESEKREAEIAALNEQNAIKTENLEQSKQLQDKQQLIIVLLALGIGAVALLMGWIYWVYLQKKKTAALLEKQNKTIAAQNEENETLLKEIHHRVKNNLQVISSLLDLQANSIQDESALSALEDGQSRVRSMALIHQYLYQNEDIGSIPFGSYIDELTRQLTLAYEVNNKIEVALKHGDVELDIDTAIPLGLILNELVTNAFKYAAAESHASTLRIELTEPTSGAFELLVADNGPGLPADFDLSTTRSLGLRLVRRLCRQLYGSVTYSYDGGAQFLVSVKGAELRKAVS